MKLSLSLVAGFMYCLALNAQVISINPSSVFQNQSVNTVITLAPGVIQAANPPAAATDIYIEQGGSRIYTDAFTPAQIFPGTQPYTDSLAASFTIPANAIPGWYDVHVITYDALNAPVDNILTSGFVVRLPGSCPVPFNVSSDTLTGTSEIIRWDASLIADTFRVRYRLSGTTNYFYKDVDGAIPIDSVIITDLDPGSLYNVDVSTICGGIHSTYSYPIDTFTTLAETLNCVIPFGISITAVTGTTAQVNWSELAIADTFRIRYFETSTGIYQYVDVNGANPHTYTLTNLRPGTNYRVQLSSVCLGIGNGYSFFRTFTTAAVSVPCIIPFETDTSNVTNTGATISWSPNISADTFRIRYSVNGTTNYQYVDSPGTSGNSAVISGLRANVTYQYQVSSVCSGSGSGYSPSKLFTTVNIPVLCGIPYGLSNSAVTNASADVSWTNMVSADSFLVRYSENGTTNYSWKKIVGTLNSTTLTGLLPVTTYQWQVRSLCSGAPSSYSAPDIFSTPLKLADPATLVSSGISVFPNPVSDLAQVVFTASEKSISMLRIFDLSGRMVYNKNIASEAGENEIEIDVRSFASGTYLLELNQGENTFHSRLVVSHR